MSIKNDLQIFLITFNREKDLENTFEQFFAEKSPIRDFDITILDNCSTDGTQDLCLNYARQYPNLKYIKNRVNIGAVGNIIKAMESAERKWLWILGDDDNYDWSVWPEIEEALNADYDIVNTCWHIGAERKTDYAHAFNETGFISTSIYNTRNINATVRQNAYYLAPNLNPHSAIGAYVVNKTGKFYIPKERLVIETMRKNYSTIHSNKNIYLHPDVRDHNVFYDTLKIYQLIVDKKLRYQCNEVLWLGESFAFSMRAMLATGINLKKYTEVLFMLNFRQKILLLLVTVKFAMGKALANNPILTFYRTDKGINIKLFAKFKTKIIPWKRNNKSCK